MSANQLALTEIMDHVRNVYFRNYRISAHLAWRDQRQRFSQSVIGPFWATLSVLLSSVVLGLVWGVLFDIDIWFQLPFASSGITAWGLISGTLVEAPSHFINGKSLLLNTRAVGPSIVSKHLLARNVLNFLFAAPVPIALSFVGGHLTWSVVLLPLTLTLVATALYPYCVLLGLFGIRLRDLEHFFPSVFLLLFLVTPIFFQQSQLGKAQWIATFNPFFWLVEMLRRPLFGQNLSAMNFSVTLLIFAIGFVGLRITEQSRLQIKTYL